jgi:carboxyl-terminal processing protease
MRRIAIFLPLICGFCLAAGILLGSFIGRGNRRMGGNDSSDKIRAVLGYVQENYVDSVDTRKLTDNTLVAMLQSLDPHSDYFTAEQIQAMNEPLQGNFEGIGIEYNFVRDTLIVMSVIPGGPSEAAGLQAGDRLLRANDTLIVGKTANEKFVKSKLRGPSGTKVTVMIKRPTVASPFVVTITRGSIPIFSVEASYMVDKETGYIRLSRFSETSYDEFMKASDSLMRSGMKKMILDLRGNGGGLLSAATDIADEFLPEGKKIVYTKGRADGENMTLATKKGRLEKMPLAILVDENSASASEIVAGAIQDNDRGTIIGRRTFGKGLVQEEKQLTDGSAFRLTIARYYTPSGRCIQKPYDKGIAAYEDEESQRYKHGELLNRDSIHFPDSLKFKTPAGRTVYGGGGIMPDLFVPLDTAGGSEYLNNLFYKNVFTLWALDFSIAHKAELRAMGQEKYRREFQVTDAMLADLVNTADKNGVKKDETQLRRSVPLILRYMKANIARHIWGDAVYYEIWNDGDTVLTAAMEVLRK